MSDRFPEIIRKQNLWSSQFFWNVSFFVWNNPIVSIRLSVSSDPINPWFVWAPWSLSARTRSQRTLGGGFRSFIPSGRYQSLGTKRSPVPRRYDRPGVSSGLEAAMDSPCLFLLLHYTSSEQGNQGFVATMGKCPVVTSLLDFFDLVNR